MKTVIALLLLAIAAPAQVINGPGGASGPTTAAGVVALFSTCSGVQYLGADGACHAAAGGFTAPDGWTASAGGMTAGTSGLSNSATRTCAGTVTCFLWQTVATITSVANKDTKIWSTVNTITGDGNNDTWSNVYDQTLYNMTNAAGVVAHALQNVQRLTYTSTAGSTCTLCSTLYVTLGLTNANGASTSLEGIHYEWDSGMSGTGTITEMYDINAGAPAAITGSPTVTSMALIRTGDISPVAVPGTSKAGIAIGGVISGKKAGLTVTANTPASIDNMAIFDSGSPVQVKGGLVVASCCNVVAGEFSGEDANDTFGVIVNAQNSFLYSYDGTGAFEFGVSHADSSNFVIRRPSASANGLRYTRSTGAMQLGELATWGTASGFAMIEGTAPTNVAGDGALYADSTSHELMYKANGGSTTQTITATMPSPISLTGQTAAITNSTSLCGTAAGSCGVAGKYKVSFYLASTVTCATPGAAAIGPTVTYTDDAGTKTAQAVPLDVNGGTSLGATMALGNTTNSSFGSTEFWSTGANAIGYGITYTGCTSGTGTYSARVHVERLF